MTDLLSLANAVGMPVMVLLGFLYWKLTGRIEGNKDALNKFKLYIAETYATTNVVEGMEARILASLTRIETRLDSHYSSDNNN
jgi:hypothetical protein